MPRQSRAQATRLRLLHATVEALSECGYSGTSTQEVCRRAGVSRGTLQHHFPTRIDLLVGSLDAILADRVAQFVVAHRQEDKLEPAELLKALWMQWQGPVYAAWLELAVAARTEPALRGPMREVMERFDEEILVAFRELLDTSYMPPHLQDVVPFITFALFNGLAVGRSYEAEERRAAIPLVVEGLARLLPAIGAAL